MKKRFAPKFNIRKDDQVVVITGADKDLTTPRRVLSVIPSESKVLVEGVAMVTKHKKPSAQSPQGGIVREEAPIHISNVMLWDAAAKAPAKIRRERAADGTVSRINKKTGAAIK